MAGIRSLDMLVHGCGAVGAVRVAGAYVYEYRVPAGHETSDKPCGLYSERYASYSKCITYKK